VPDPAEIGVVLVGLGVRGRTWVDVCRTTEGVELIATVDADPARGADYRELEHALDLTDANVVVVATPPESHHGLVSLAVAKNKHVICEKPLSEDLAEVRDLIARAKVVGVHLLVGMNFRYLSTSQTIREHVETRRLGELAYASFSYVRHRDGRREDLNDYPLTMRHPMLFEQSVHHFDLLRYCYGREVEALVADTFRPASSTYEGDCCVSVQFRLEGGARVSYLGTWTASWNKMDFRWRSDFEGGVLTQREQFDDLVRVDFQPELGMSGPRFKTREQSEPEHVCQLVPCVPFIDDTRGLLKELMAALRDGDRTVTTAADHLETLLVVEACVVSAREQRWVRLSELR